MHIMWIIIINTIIGAIIFYRWCGSFLWFILVMRYDDDIISEAFECLFDWEEDVYSAAFEEESIPKIKALSGLITVIVWEITLLWILLTMNDMCRDIKEKRDN